MSNGLHVPEKYAIAGGPSGAVNRIGALIMTSLCTENKKIIAIIAIAEAKRKAKLWLNALGNHATIVIGFTFHVLG